MSPLIWQINKFNPYLFQNNVDKTTSVKVNSLKTSLNFFIELETWNKEYFHTVKIVNFNSHAKNWHFSAEKH